MNESQKDYLLTILYSISIAVVLFGFVVCMDAMSCVKEVVRLFAQESEK